MLVTYEGIDGAGKTTAINATQDERPDAIITTEPNDDAGPNGSDWVGNAVRRAISSDDTPALATFHLFLADHYQHLHDVIYPGLDISPFGANSTLEPGDDESLIISDRYSDSRFAYQTHALRDIVDGNTMDWVRAMQESGPPIRSEDPSPDAVHATYACRSPYWTGDLIHTAANTPTHPRTDIHLFLADYHYGRAQVGKTSDPETPVVVSDEYITTFQSYDRFGVAEGDAATWRDVLTERSFDVLPDVTLLLDISVDESFRRKAGDTKEVFEKREFLQNARANYLTLAERDPNRVECINAEQAPDDVVASVLDILDDRGVITE